MSLLAAVFIFAGLNIIALAAFPLLIRYSAHR